MADTSSSEVAAGTGWFGTVAQNMGIDVDSVVGTGSSKAVAGTGWIGFAA